MEKENQRLKIKITNLNRKGKEYEIAIDALLMALDDTKKIISEKDMYIYFLTEEIRRLTTRYEKIHEKV